MNTRSFSRQEALQFGWEAAKRSLGFFVILLIIIMAVSGTFSALTKMRGTLALIALVAAVANFVIQQLFGIGLTRIALKFCDREKPEVADLFSGGSLFFNYFFTTILYGLIVAAGMILLIVPGVIWAIRFGMAPYLVVDKGLGPMEALRKSSELTSGVKWDLFVFGLVLVGINLLGLLALGIGLLWTIPTALVAAAFVYRALLAQTETSPAAVTPAAG